MAIYKTAYDTTLGQALQTHKIEQGLKTYLIEYGEKPRTFDGLNVISSVKYFPVELYGSISTAQEIPFFAHPLILEGYKGLDYLFLDSRLYKKYTSGADPTIKIVSAWEYEFVLQRFFMNYGWVNGLASEMRTRLSFAGMVYANWLSEIISRRFGLDPREQKIVALVSHFFYQECFMQEVSYSEEEKQGMAMQAAKAVNAPGSMAFDVIDQIGKPMTDVKGYCEALTTVLQNVRLKDFTHGALYTLVGLSWYGQNGKEIIAIALEHVPTWMAICYAAITNRSYKHSTVSNLVDKLGRQGLSEGYAKAFAMISKEMTTNYATEEQSRQIEQELLALEQVVL